MDKIKNLIVQYKVIIVLVLGLLAGAASAANMPGLAKILTVTSDVVEEMPKAPAAVEKASEASAVAPGTTATETPVVEAPAATTAPVAPATTVPEAPAKP